MQSFSKLNFIVCKFEIIDTVNWLFSGDHSIFNKENTLSTSAAAPCKLRINSGQQKTFPVLLFFFSWSMLIFQFRSFHGHHLFVPIERNFHKNFTSFYKTHFAKQKNNFVFLQNTKILQNSSNKLSLFRICLNVLPNLDA